MIVVSYNGCVMTLVKSLYVLVKLKLHYVKHHFVFQGHVYILRFWACYYDLHPHARFSASQVKLDALCFCGVEHVKEMYIAVSAHKWGPPI